MSAFPLLGFGAGGWGNLLLYGVLMTAAITASSLALGSVLGSAVAAMRMSRNLPARLVSEGYTTTFRGVPELLVIYCIYFGGTNAATALGRAMGYDGFVGFPSFLAGTLGVGLISGAYQAEVYRGSFLAVSKGELEAARAVGMPPLLRLRRIIVPQVLRFALPGLGNVLQMALKDSALVSVTGLAEIMRTAQYAAGSTHQYLLFYAAGGTLYLIMTSLSNVVFDVAEARVAKTFIRPSNAG